MVHKLTSEDSSASITKKFKEEVDRKSLSLDFYPCRMEVIIAI